MPVDSAATSNTFCLLNDRTINARQSKNFIYVTSQLDGSDVITRRYPARQHERGRGVATHTGDASVGQETQLPASCSSGTVQSLHRRCTTSVPAVKRTCSVSHARHTLAAQDHPVYIKTIYLQHNSCCPVRNIPNAFPLQKL